MERVNTEAGVFSAAAGPGENGSSAEVTEDPDELFLSLPVDSDLARPFVATVS